MSELTDFLKDNKEHIRIATLEREAGIYQGAVTKAINDIEYRNLTPEQEKAVYKYLCRLKRGLDKLLEKNLVDNK